ncbi:MAG: hypothetical protein IJU01_07705 [Lachnospiraceae bacterium]|nr:hypothetical protein [Lachnospiraceae bacterium]
MIRILMGKELSEFLSPILVNRKTGKPRSKGAIAGVALLFLLIAVSSAASIFFLAMFFADVLVRVGLTWLYFAMMGAIALFLGVILNVFATYNALFVAKDNDMLISMPIRPSQILVARMVSLYLLALLITVLVWFPALIQYWIIAEPTAVSVVFCIIMTFVISGLILVLSCLLGWLVGLVMSKVRSKALITTVLYLLLFGLYYVIYFRMNSILQSFAANVGAVETAMSGKLNPLYIMGRAAGGDIINMLIFTLSTAALLAICIFIMSKTFIKIATSNKGTKRKEYRPAKNAAHSPSLALLSREAKRFFGTPLYFLNAGLGLLIMLFGSVLLVIKADGISGFFLVMSNQIPWVKETLSVGAAVLVIMILATNAVTAPSISLEGKTLWILKSLPVSTRSVLNAKIKLHIILNYVPLAVLLLVAGIFLGFDAVDMIFVAALCAVFVPFMALLGIVSGLKHPMMEWTNETVPIKQSAGVAICLFGSWGIAVLIGGLYYLFYVVLSMDFLTARVYLIIWTVIIAFFTIYMKKWTDTKGEKIFAGL